MVPAEDQSFPAETGPVRDGAYVIVKVGRRHSRVAPELVDLVGRSLYEDGTPLLSSRMNLSLERCLEQKLIPLRT